MVTDLADRFEIAPPVLGLLTILLVAQVGLAIVALVDLARRDRVAGGRKWLWIGLILIGNVAGSILYLVVGRDVPPQPAEVAWDSGVSGISRAERIRRGLDELYGSQMP